jgi:hypothetical protein
LRGCGHLSRRAEPVRGVDRRAGDRSRRQQTATAKWGASLEDGVRALQAGLEDIPRRGLWLDTTGQTPEQTVDAILGDLEKARW